MKELLRKLDDLIKKTRPDYYGKLNTPLSESEINGLETKFNLSLPQDLKELYLWKNGQNSACYESFINNSEFMELEDSLETAVELTSMIGSDFETNNWWNENWLPIFHNGGGSYICYDLKGVFTSLEGQIIEFWKADNDRNVIAPNLESFLKQLVGFYEFVKPVDFDIFFSG
jgi:cell wall assembly regulator SMI1